MIDGTYILTAAIGLLVLLAAWLYAEWARWDDYRRLERRAHRNLQKMGGGSR